MRSWGGDPRWLEGVLRGRRSDAPEELVRAITARVLASPAAPPRAWSRVAFASAVAVFILGTFASFGGLGYAASGASGTYDAVKQIVVAHKLKVVVPESSATNQYKPPKPKAKPFKPPKTPKPAALHAAVNAQGQTLPFTGFSLLGAFVASLALVGVGVYLRRRERRG